MIKNIFIKEKMKLGKTVLGAWNTIPSPLVTEFLASSGLDFVIVDFEHGPFNPAELSSYFNAAIAHGVSPVARTSILSDWMTQQCLDQGSHGIIYPHIKNIEDVNKVVEYSKYPPVGKRGFSPFTKATSFSDKEFSNYTEYANNNLLNIVLVEDKEGLQNIDQISKNPNVDVVYFGSYDISSEFGIPGQTRDKKVLDAVFNAASIAKSNGKYVGGFLCSGLQDAKWLESQGLNFLVYQVDSYILKNNVNTFCREFRG